MMNIHTTVAVTLTYAYECGVPGCNQKAATLEQLWVGAAMPRPCVPEGWRSLQGLSICPHHRIEVQSERDHSDEMWIVEGEDQWSTQESADRAERAERKRAIGSGKLRSTEAARLAFEATK